MTVLETIVHESTAEHTGTVIWMHGLGADGHDFESLVPMMDSPHTRFVFPHAPIRPVTMNGGMRMRSWYDIRNHVSGPHNDRESLEEVEESHTLLLELIESEQQNGIPFKQIILAGFSQGGAMSLYTGCRFPHQLAGIMVLSSYLLFPDAHKTESHPSNIQTPILFCHGSYDPMVDIIQAGKKSYDLLVEEGRTCEWHEYPMGHEVCMPEVREISRWISECIP